MASVMSIGYSLSAPISTVQPKPRVYQEMIEDQLQTTPPPRALFNTQVHEIPLSNGATAKLRLYNPEALSIHSQPILFIPGFGPTAEGGAPYVEHGQQAPGPIFSLDRSYVDKDGFCLSPQALMTELEGTLDYLYQLTGRKVNVVGFSLGGLFAAHLAAHKPEKIARLALLSPTLPTHAQLQVAKQIVTSQDPQKQDDSQRAFELLASHLPDTFRKIRVPTALYMGQEAQEGLEANALNYLVTQVNAPYDFRYFDAAIEGHAITTARLNALTRWLTLPLPAKPQAASPAALLLPNKSYWRPQTSLESSQGLSSGSSLGPNPFWQRSATQSFDQSQWSNAPGSQ